MKQKLALDFDNVLYSNKLIYDILSEKNIDSSLLKTWEMLELPKEVREEILEKLSDPKFVCNPYHIIDQSQEAVLELSMYYDIIVVTSRCPRSQLATRLFIYEMYPEVQEIFFVGGGSKSNVLLEQNVDLFVDDHPRHVESAMFVGINTLLLSNKYTPHNHDFLLSGKVKSISHIREILEKF